MSDARMLTPAEEQVQKAAKFFGRIKNHPARAKIVEQIIQNIFNTAHYPGMYQRKLIVAQDKGNEIFISFEYRGGSQGKTSFNFRLHENGFNFSLRYHVPAYSSPEGFDPEENCESQITEKSVTFKQDDSKCLSEITKFLTEGIENVYLFSKSVSSSYSAMSAVIPFSASTENKITPDEEQQFLSECSPETQTYIKKFTEITQSIIECLTVPELKKLNLLDKNDNFIDKAVQLNGRIYPLSQVIGFNYEDLSQPIGQRFFEAVDIKPAVMDADIGAMIDSRYRPSEQAEPVVQAFSHLGLR